MLPHRLPPALAGLLVALAVAAGFAKEPVPVPPDVQDCFNEGRAARARGAYPEAAAAYRRASALARERGLKTLAGEAALRLGEVLQEAAQRTNEDYNPARLREVERAYRDAADLGSGRVKLLAQNNLGVLLLRLGKDRAGEAVQVFGAMDLGAGGLEPSERALYAYNKGRALEKADQPDKAYAAYRQALGQQPRYAPAADAAFRLLLKEPTDKGTQEALRLARELSDHGQGDVAVRQVRACLERWPNPDAPALLTVLVRHYAATALCPVEYRDREAKALQELARKVPALQPYVAEIDIAYLGDFEPAFSRGELANVFPKWSHAKDDPKAFAALLKVIGDAYYPTSAGAGKRVPSNRPPTEERDPRKALARYAASWVLDPEVTETALYVAAVLRDSPRLDPERRWYLQFVDALMEIKGDRYKIEVKGPADWDNLLRLHVLLGSLFAQEKHWGPQDDPRSALFQWTRALKAEEQLRKQAPETPPSPFLHVYLGDAYRETGRPDLAWARYLAATEGFVALKDRTAAEKALQQAKALKRELSPVDKARLTRIEDALAPLPPRKR
jgi:tetratricopeptide (TPR) repeat protein